MSLTIHHGPNGSFKTSGVVQDYFIPAALEGRTVVTNIRGMSTQNTFEHLEDTKEGFEVVFVDTGTSEGRERIKRWWHWVPQGALLLFDEAGVIFPKSMTTKEIESLAFPGGVDAAEVQDRPHTWIEAWEMHRHFNWDIILSCPNIKSVRDDIRNTTEGAYKHRNLALLGSFFQGKYKEGFHSAQDNGTSASHFENVSEVKTIKPVVFKLYDSTKTGVAKDTLNGGNVLLQMRVILPLVVAISAISYSVLSGGYDYFFTDWDAKAAEVAGGADSGVSVVPAARGTDPAPPPRSGHVESKPDRQAVWVDHPLQSKVVKVAGFVQSASSVVYLVEVQHSERRVDRMTSVDLKGLGYNVTPVSDCAVQLKYRNQVIDLSCIASEIM